MKTRHRSAVVPALLLALAPVLGAGQAAGADLQTISHGDRVELAAHLVAGKYTLFDFYADWCSGCQQLEPIIRDLADAHAEQLAVRKIDIVRWSSPVADQYRLQAIPHLRLFDPAGKLVAQGDGATVLRGLAAALPGTGTGDVTGQQTSGGALSFLVLLTALVVSGLLLLGSIRRPPAADPGPEATGTGPDGRAGS